MGNLSFKYLTTKQVTTYGIFALIGTYAFGGWTPLLELLCILIGVDYVTGIAASIKEGKGLSSEVGGWGLFKKALTLLVVIVGHRIDVAFAINYVMNGAVYFYLCNELLSITENYGRIGLPLPSVITQIIAVLKNKSGSQQTEIK